MFSIDAQLFYHIANCVTALILTSFDFVTLSFNDSILIDK